MTIAILTQFVRQSTIEMEGEEVKYGDLRDNDNTSDFVEGCGQQGDQAAGFAR